MRMKLAIPDRLITPEGIEATLEATTLADEQAIMRGEIPDVREAIAGGVKWQPEPYTDGEHFDLGHEVVRRGWGDCDDLAPWLAGSLRASGEDPEARVRVFQSGPNRWHVVTETGDGRILDPSKWAGMGKRSAPSVSGVSGAVTSPLAAPLRGALYVSPHRGIFRARADVPFDDSDAHLASHGSGRTPERALDMAVSGALCCGDHVSEGALDRLRDAGTMLLADADELRDLLVVGEMVDPLFLKLKERLAAKGKFATDDQLDAIVAAIRRAGPIAVNVFMHPGFHAPALITHVMEKVASQIPVFGKTVSDKMSSMEAKAKREGRDVADEERRGASVLAKLASGKHTLPGARSGKPNKMSVSTGDRPMTLYYHPAGSIGPVVVRF